jgi:CDGSH-type Zn-finger protein
MAEVNLRKDGPYHLKGDVEIKDADGKTVDTGTEFWLCRCGQSRTKPFCDGTHKKTGFTAD